jgi:hypothetical protein
MFFIIFGLIGFCIFTTSVYAIDLSLLEQIAETGLNDMQNADQIDNKSNVNGLDKINSLLSPIQQFKSGIPLEQIQCKSELELVQRASDSSPVCLKPETKIKLLLRGWAIQIPELDSQKIFLEGLKDVYKVNESLVFTIVNKDIGNCNSAEVEIFNKNTGEGHGIEIEYLCNSASGETRIDVPMGDSDMPVKIENPGTYLIILKVEGKGIFEKELLVR